MDDSFYVKKRAHPRINVILMATFQARDKGSKEQDCAITNVSVSGAGVTFPRAEAATIVPGATVMLKIRIPKTVLYLTVQAEVMWAKQRTRDVIAGLKFSEMLSAGMFLQFQKTSEKG